MNANEKPQQKAIREEEAAMSDILTGIIDTEMRKYTFQKQYEFFGKTLKGTFEAKYMSIADRLKIGVLRAKLLDGAPQSTIDRLTDDIAYMISYLQVALIKTPKWWNYDILSLDDDLTKLKEVYNEVYEFNKSFRKYYVENFDAGDSSNAFGSETMGD